MVKWIIRLKSSVALVIISQLLTFSISKIAVVRLYYPFSVNISVSLL